MTASIVRAHHLDLLRPSTDAKQNLLLFHFLLSSLLRLSLSIEIDSLNAFPNSTVPLTRTPPAGFTEQSLPVLSRHTWFTGHR